MEPASAYLPDDVVIEILVRLPSKPLCRFKCVSQTWRRLISDPAHRHRFAQTLSGLFYYRRRHPGADPPCFAGLPAPPPPGVDTALSFLPPSCAEMELLDSCNGLLLLRSSLVPRSPQPRFYVVCNPATGRWVTLPQPSHAPGEICYVDEMVINTWTAALGFDPAISSHFHVFQLVEKIDEYVDIVVAVEIYSSVTGKWILKKSGWRYWSKDDHILCNFHMTYLNGFLHFTIIYDAVVSVDTKGQTWRVTHVQQRHEPDDLDDCFVGHSQGRLLHVDCNLNDDSISVYVLEDHDSWEWTFKHSVSKLDLIPPRQLSCGSYFEVAALHPDGNLIYFYDLPRERLMSYDMTHGVVHVICTLIEVSHAHRPFLPYVPSYSGPLVLSSAD